MSIEVDPVTQVPNIIFFNYLKAKSFNKIQIKI